MRNDWTLFRRAYGRVSRVRFKRDGGHGGISSRAGVIDEGPSGGTDTREGDMKRIF